MNHPTTAQKLDWIDNAIAELKDKGLFTHIRTLSSPQGARLVVDGRPALNFCSNNYLGLANDPRLIDAVERAMAQYGVGPGAVRTIAGTLGLHLELEEKLAAFKETEAAIVLQSGFTANLATIPALVGRGDVIFSDRLNHASIIDGCRLSGAKIIAYAHNDMQDLEARLEENRGEYDRAIIITDGVFSMDGDIAPLPDIAKLAERFACMTMVDDAHGEGVLGHGGRGIVHHYGLQGTFDIEVGTMSKAFGVMGGYVAGKQAIVDWLKQRGRPFLFSSALTVPDTAACIAAVDILQASTELVDRLWSNTAYFQEEMQALGFDIGQTVTPVTPVMIGDEQRTQAFSRRLYEEGVFATAIAFPTVALGQARIRVMLSAAHSRQDLDEALAIFSRVGRELNIIS